MQAHRRFLALATRLALLAILGLSALLTAEPARYQAHASPMLQLRDLGTPDANGVTMVERLAGVGQVNGYTFRVGPGPGTIQVYVGDLYYDVDVSLWQSSSPAEELAGRGGCNRAFGCKAESGPSRRRVVQFVEPKSILEAAESGTYTVLVRARDGEGFDPGRPFTLRVAVTPPVCHVQRGPDDRYTAALAVVPPSATRSSLITMVAYVMPPFTDLFDFAWSVQGFVPTDTLGSTAQVPAFSLPQTLRGIVTANVTIRGARQYTDPTDPTYSHVPFDGGSMTLLCDIGIADR
jgi:hypothetical protein